MKATWKPYEVHGKLTMKSDLPDTVFAFPGQRKEPLTDATHVRDAAARFDQVIDVTDEDRELAFANIQKAAQHFGVHLKETSWRELGVHPQLHRKAIAKKGAQTRMRTGESEEAARKAAATKQRFGIAEEAALKGAETRRRKRDEEND